MLLRPVRAVAIAKKNIARPMFVWIGIIRALKHAVAFGQHIRTKNVKNPMVNWKIKRACQYEHGLFEAAHGLEFLPEEQTVPSWAVQASCASSRNDRYLCSWCIRKRKWNQRRRKLLPGDVSLCGTVSPRSARSIGKLETIKSLKHTRFCNNFKRSLIRTYKIHLALWDLRPSWWDAG